MLNSQFPPELLSELIPLLQQQHITPDQIIRTCNSLSVRGDGNIIFQDSHNNRINILLPLDNPQMLQHLAKRIAHHLQPNPTPHRIGDPWQANAIFLGRTQDIETIARQFCSGKAIVLLNGIGGIGKTALANELSCQIGDQYNHVIWTNLQNTAAKDEQPLRNYLLYNSLQLHQDLGITEVLHNERDETQKWAILLRALKQLGNEVLWIIDNAHQQDQTTINELPDNCSILLTSRHTIGNISTHYVDELAHSDALNLFKHHYQHSDNDQIILAICGAVGYHALGIELLAKTLNELPNKNASFLWQSLQNKGININRQQQIWTDYARRETYLNECLLAAFDLGKLQEQTTLHQLLRIFCLMPYHDVSYAVVQQLTQTEGDEQEDELLHHLQQLSKLGWIKSSQTTWLGTTQKSWRMHTVVQDVVQQQLGHDEDLENGVVDILNSTSMGYFEKNPIKAQVWRPFLEAIIKKVLREVMSVVWCYDVLVHLLNVMGQHDSALSHGQKSVQMAEGLLPPLHHDLAKLYMTLAVTYQNLTQYNAALSYYEYCRVIWEQTLPPQHPDLATLYMNMASTYSGLTHYETALSYYERCREIREQVLPPQHPDLAKLYLNMANTYKKLTRYDTALSYYERCRAIREQILPPQHPNLANLYMNMASTYTNLVQYDTALAYYERCRAIQEQILPPQHPDLASLYMNIGITHRALTHYDIALSYYDRCRSIREQILPAQHPDLADVYMNLGNNYAYLARYDSALIYYERCRVIWEQNLSPRHPNLAKLYMNVANTYDSLTHHDLALAYYDRCRIIWEHILPAQHPHLATLYMNIANTYWGLNQYDTALVYYDHCRVIWEQILPARHPNLASLYMNIANVYRHQTQYSTALVYYEHCRVIFEQVLPTKHSDLASLYLNMANAYTNIAQYDTALVYYERCRAIWEQILSPQHSDLAILYYNMAELYSKQSQFLKAQIYINQAVAIYRKNLSPEHTYLQQAIKLKQHICRSM